MKGLQQGAGSKAIENIKDGFRGWHERGYLPHRDEKGLTQFVTIRLKDSFPAVLRAEWEQLWKIEDDRKKRAELEAYLDKGRGECHLRVPEIACLAEESLRCFHGQRYELKAWVVMPNHVHALFRVGDVPMSEVLEGWKKFIAREANLMLGRRGAFWEADYWDTFMRDEEHELKARLYIEKNPLKARLTKDMKEWAWGSARFRDEYGRLKL
ncbi:MAG: transposase [Verrucomicrobiota bacterium]